MDNDILRIAKAAAKTPAMHHQIGSQQRIGACQVIWDIALALFPDDRAERAAFVKDCGMRDGDMLFDGHKDGVSLTRLAGAA